MNFILVYHMAPCTTWGAWQPRTLYGSSFGALNHVRFRAAMNPMWFVARPARLERATCGFVVRRSIQLSYGRFLELVNNYFTEKIST